MAGSLYSARSGPTTRQIDARIRRRTREADQAEAGLVAGLLADLAVLQTEVRALLADQSTAPTGVLLAAVEARVAAHTGTLVAATVDHLRAAAAQGAAVIDEVLAMAGLALPLVAPDHQALIDRLTRQARILIGRSTDLVTLATANQVALLHAGTQDLAATLAAVGTELTGSTVFGRAAERLAGATTALTGEAFGAAQAARADETHLTRTAEALTPTSRVILLKRWISSHKRDARHPHAAAEARYGPGGTIGPIPYSDDFRVGTWRTPYPRGPGLPGAQKVHCGCRVQPVLASADDHEPLPLDASPAGPPPTAPPPAAGGGTVPPGSGAGGPVDPDDLKAILDRHYRPWADNLTTDQIQALRTWQSTDRFYQQIQAVLRGGGPTDPATMRQIRRIIGHLDDAVAAGATPLDLTAYRGLRNLANATGVSARSAGRLIGRTLQDDAFVGASIDVSTALSQFTGPAGALLEVRVPAGTPAAWVSLVGRAALADQLELLFPRRTTLSVVGVRAGTPVTLICEVVT